MIIKMIPQFSQDYKVWPRYESEKSLTGMTTSEHSLHKQQENPTLYTTESKSSMILYTGQQMRLYIGSNAMEMRKRKGK